MSEVAIKKIGKFMSDNPEIRCCNCANAIKNNDVLHANSSRYICLRHDRPTSKNSMCSEFR